MEKEKKTLFESLLEIQKEIRPIIKDNDNPFFKSKYADLNSVLSEIKPLLNNQGLLLTQPVRVDTSGGVIVESVISCGQERIVSSLVIPQLSDPQKIGACITYFRRFTLMSLLALETEDDDGNLASGKEINKAEKAKVQGYMPKAMKVERETKQNEEFNNFMGL